MSPADTGSARIRRGLRPGDLAALAELTRESAWGLSAQRLRGLVLGDPHLLDAEVLIAETPSPQGEVTSGYLHLTREGETSYLVSGAVHPARQGRGLGGMLWEEALRRARIHGSRQLIVGGYPPAYLLPGIDEGADPRTGAFLRSRGARATGVALAMHRDLPSAPTVPTLPGVRIAPAEPEDLPVLLAEVTHRLSPEWGSTLGRYAAAGGDPSRILVAREDPAPPALTPQSLLGMAARGIVGEDPDRFGPFGVLPAARGRGVGRALLAATEQRMAADGASRSWFLWTTPDSPAHRLYRSRGYEELARLTTFVADLGDPVPRTDPEPGSSAVSRAERTHR